MSATEAGKARKNADALGDISVAIALLSYLLTVMALTGVMTDGSCNGHHGLQCIEIAWPLLVAGTAVGAVVAYIAKRMVAEPVGSARLGLKLNGVPSLLGGGLLLLLLFLLQFS